MRPVIVELAGQSSTDDQRPFRLDPSGRQAPHLEDFEWIHQRQSGFELLDPDQADEIRQDLSRRWLLFLDSRYVGHNCGFGTFLTHLYASFSQADLRILASRSLAPA